MAPTKRELFSDDESESGLGEKTTQLTINEHYAKAFQYRKEREELERLQAKYGSDYDPNASSANDEESTDSESAESEDEVGEELTPAVDAAILRTLARIKKRDPAIYDSGVNIYGEEVEKVGTRPLPSAHALVKKDKSKPITLRQLNIQSQLSPNNSRSPSPEPLTHVQEQAILRKETIAAFHAAVPEEGDDFLIPREKTKDELKREEEEYKAFLEREVGDLRELVSVGGSDEEDEGEDADDEDAGKKVEMPGEEGGDVKDKKKRKKKKKKSKAKAEEPKKSKSEQDQEFLMNYILNRGWIDWSAGHVPTYNEVTSQPAPERRKKEKPAKVDAEGDEAAQNDKDDTGLLSDASFDSLASHFEASYNHRFEEPDAAVIPTYPRNLDGLLRRTDTTRKEARERRKLRKQEEIEKKKEEVKRLKALKMREVKRKLGMIGMEGGLKRLQKLGEDGDDEDENEEFQEAMRELDLEGDWDPEKHDRQMKGLFEGEEVDFSGMGGGEDAWDGEGEDEDVKYDEDGKPVWDDDIDIGDIPMVDDDAVDVPYGMGMDVDVVSKGKDKKEKDKKKKKKKKSGDDDDDEGVDIDAMDADIKPSFNEDEDEEWDGTEEMRKRKLNEYMDQIYGLDFNDVVGGLPTRFKYTQVKSDTLALNPVEILMATDKELNEYVGIKKYAPYRQGEDKSRYTKKRQEKLQELKGTVKERMVKAGWAGAVNGAWGAAASGSGSRGGAAARASRAGVVVGDDDKPKKRLGKKERMKLRAAQGGEDGEDMGEGDGDVSMEPHMIESPRKEKEKKRKRDVDEVEMKKGVENVQPPAMKSKSKSKKEEVKEEEKRRGDGDQPKKKRKRKHKAGADGGEVEV